MDINVVWNNIICHEGDVFHTIKGKPYIYIIHDGYLIIENVKGGRIKKEYIEKAMRIDTPNTRKIALEGCWGPSYIYGIITDERIMHK